MRILVVKLAHGIIPLSIRGVVWCQGENEGANKNYAQTRRQ